jgi:peptidoglycan-associated lipoprotein
MFCRHVLGRLVLLSVAFAPLCANAQSDDRMRLGTPISPSAEFQTQVGDRVFFSDGSADLGTKARAALAAQAAWLLQRPTLRVTIEGHADDAGVAALNHEVSLRRAEAVRKRLIEMGVATDRIRIVSFGRDRLIAECTASACMAQNRRVVTVIGEPSAAAAPPTEPARDSAAAKRPPRRLY